MIIHVNTKVQTTWLVILLGEKTPIAVALTVVVNKLLIDTRPCGHKTFEHDFCTQTQELTNQNTRFHVSSMIFVLRALSKV